jgi:hypothetical protein
MLKNELLQKASAEIQSKATDPDMLQRMVKAGLKIIYNQNIFQKLTRELRQSKDPAGDAARGAVFVLQMLAQRARGTAKPQVLVQAGVLLMLDALDFLEQAGLLKVDATTLDHATQEYVEAVLPAVGISHDRMNQTLGQVKQVMADPQKMAQYRQSLGAKQ